jgi:hypothetical protein
LIPLDVSSSGNVSTSIWEGYAWKEPIILCICS